MQNRSIPRALRGNILASVPRALTHPSVTAAGDDQTALLRRLTEEVTNFRSDYDNRLSNLQAAMNSDSQAVGASKFDVLLRAIAQAEAADLPAMGVIVNSADWLRLQGVQDDQGRYIGTRPMGMADAGVGANLIHGNRFALSATMQTMRSTRCPRPLGI